MDILMELNSHIFEAIQNSECSDEHQVINEIVDHLGEPKDIWNKTEIETRLTNQKHQNKHTVKSFTQNFKFVTLYTLSYMLMVFSVLLISGKVYFGEKFGLFYREGSFVLGGIEDGIHYLAEHERLGMFYIPFWIMCFIFSSFLIRELKKDEEKLQMKNEFVI